ncbi:MAG: hypothetical protein IGBAC_0751 [Ignavibacteriae bacterium]|nr:MAG: hypothetical protein IGBAC_0751 [Ignavibacteriota bacterium]
MDSWNVREPAVAGMFYPVDKKSLMRQVVELFERAKPKKIKGQIKALISPHAGYVYSGLTAAYAYKLLENKKYDSVVVISPSHREYFDGISIFPGTYYRTPLGDVPLDLELCKLIIENESSIKLSQHGHIEEHALEVQLPFLQIILESFKLVPIVMGDQKKEYCYKIGDVLGKVLKNRNALIVASTDLSHYHPYDVANQLDKIAIDAIANFDYEKLLFELEEQNTEACGGGPAAAAMIAAKKLGANKVEIMHSCNSGDVTGDKDAVVGYMSAVVYEAHTNEKK